MVTAEDHKNVEEFAIICNYLTGYRHDAGHSEYEYKILRYQVK
jgi:hypothetical protein